MQPSLTGERHSAGASGGSDGDRAHGRWGRWPGIRRVWAALGTTAFVGFTGWCLIAYRATDEARQALQAGADGAAVARGEHHWRFTPTGLECVIRWGWCTSPDPSTADNHVITDVAEAGCAMEKDVWTRPEARTMPDILAGGSFHPLCGT